jgi:diadenylate cyclase
MEIIDLIKSTILPIIDVILVAVMLYYAYKLVRGTAAIIVFRGFVIIYIIWWITDVLNMNILSSILGGFIGVGVFAVIIVFQQEIRKFLLLLGSSRIANNKSLWKKFTLFFKISKEQAKLNINEFIIACNKLQKTKTGAIFVFERTNSLDFIKDDGDKINSEVSSAIIESIFYKNGPLHDGAVIVVGNLIVSSRVTLPVSKNKKINKSFGLRHKAAMGISEESDALCIVISEESGKISYIKNGDFCNYKNDDELKSMLLEDLSE